MRVLRVRLRSRRLAASVLASFAATLTIAAVPAVAGQYDYTLYSIPVGAWASRGVSHDYSYLRGGATYQICLRRNSTGTAFCTTAAGGQVAHSYPDSCNPSSCYSEYWNGGSVPMGIIIHDEWR